MVQLWKPCPLMILTTLTMTTRFICMKVSDLYQHCQGAWVPKSTKGRVEAGRKEQEREEVLLVDSSSQSDAPSEASSHEIWLPESETVVDQDQAEHSSSSSDFHSVLKVGFTGMHTRLPPCAPTLSSSRALGTIDATKAVGKGTRLVPVSYTNTQDLTITFFMPVRVDTALEETCVKALVAEKNAEFNRKHGRLNLARLANFYIAHLCLFSCVLGRNHQLSTPQQQ